MDSPLAELPRDARLTAHFASQLASAPGTTLAPPTDDFLHTALSWNADANALAGVVVASQNRTLLSTTNLELRIVDAGAETVSLHHFALTKRTIDEALAWLAEQFGAPLHLPAHELPDHPILRGKAFAPPGPDHIQVTNWLAFANECVARAVAEETTASPLTVWPHHFDLASMVVVGRDDDGADRTVGIGLSLGDGAYPQPYFYVSPWPYPDSAAVPKLTQGHWHTEGFTAAILEAEALIGLQPAAATRTADAFLLEAVAAAKQSLVR